jgi:Mg/Co/Ni transporter MgtE
MAEIKVTSLRQRILWRAVPVGLATGLIGYLLLQLYVPIARYMYRDLEVQQGDVMGMIRGCALFALAGFVVAAALECVRKEKK